MSWQEEGGGEENVALPEEEPQPSSGTDKNGNDDDEFLEASFEFEVRADWPKERQFVGRNVQRASIDFILAVMVTAHAGLIIYVCDLDAAGNATPSWIQQWMVVNLTVFTLEAALKIYAFRSKYFTLFNCVDTAVIVCDWIFQFLVLVLDDLPPMTILRVLRILKVLRFIRAVRAFTFFRELYLMLHGLVAAMKAVMWATVLIALLLALWSVIAVEFIHPSNMWIAENTRAYDDCVRCPEAFNSVWNSATTLFQQIVAGDSWGEVSLPLLWFFPGAVFFVVPALVTIQMGLLNLVLSVIVEKAQQAHSDDVKYQVRLRREASKQAHDVLLQLFRTLDQDDSGQVSLKEMLRGYNSISEFRNSMNLMDVDCSEIEEFFNLLDQDGSGEVSYMEFLHFLRRVKNQDSASVMYLMRRGIQQLHNEHADLKQLIRSQVLPALSRLDRVAYGETPSMLSYSSGSLAEPSRFDPPNSEMLNNLQRLSHKVEEDTKRLSENIKQEMIALASSVKLHLARIGDVQSCQSKATPASSTTSLQGVTKIGSPGSETGSPGSETRSTCREVPAGRTWSHRFANTGTLDVAALPARPDADEAVIAQRL